MKHTVSEGHCRQCPALVATQPVEFNYPATRVVVEFEIADSKLNFPSCFHGDNRTQALERTPGRLTKP